MAKSPVICAATGLDEWAIETCRDYIKRFDLTREDVKIVQEEDMTLVIAKRDCRSKLKGKHMAQATYNGEDFSVTFEAKPERCDYGVPGSPVWTEYTNPTITDFEFLGFPMPIEHIPDNVYDVLLEYADECEEWD